jgi:hypothetical protein
MRNLYKSDVLPIKLVFQGYFPSRLLFYYSHTAKTSVAGRRRVISIACLLFPSLATGCAVRCVNTSSASSTALQHTAGRSRRTQNGSNSQKRSAFAITNQKQCTYFTQDTFNSPGHRVQLVDETQTRCQTPAEDARPQRISKTGLYLPGLACGNKSERKGLAYKGRPTRARDACT